MIERELAAEEIEMLQQWALELGLPEKNAWRYLPGLGLVLESVVIERRAARARRVHGLSPRAAIELAAARVGVRPKSHMKRLQRWIRMAWRHFVPDESIVSRKGITEGEIAR